MRKRKLFGCAAAAAAGIAAHVSLDRANRDANGAPPMGHVAPAQLAPSQVNHYLSGADSRLGFPSWAATLTGSLLSGIRRRLEQPRVIYCEGGLEGNALSGEGGKGSGKGAEVDASGKTALSKLEFRPFTLHSVERVSHNTRLYRFSLPSEEHQTGLTVASCLVARAVIDGKPVTRPYTPVSLNHQRGYLDLMIKTYPKPGGTMSRHCAQLQPGDTLEMKGPFKKLEYKPNMYKKIGMLAGGTGITPMLQIIREILSNPEDTTEISLIFANVTEGDILLRDELEALQYLYPNFHVYYTLDKPPRSWKQGVGFVTAEMIEKHLPPPKDDAFVLVCGPKGFVNHIAGDKGPRYSQGPLRGLLKSIGYKPEQVYKF